MVQNSKYKLEILSKAQKDILQITDYVKNKLKSPMAAKNLFNEFYKAINKRLFNPLSFKKYESKKKRDYTYYTIQVKNYTIFYIVQNDTLIITRVIYSKRNLQKLI